MGYRDPIANDPTVVPDPVASSVSGAVASILPAGVTSAFASMGIDPTLLLIAAGVAVVMVMAS